MADSRSDEAGSGTVEAVYFGFLTAEEIRRMSVKKITKPLMFDAKRTPVAEGLYDPALGPINEIDSCKSCGQLSFRCPGHCGHIDFTLPIYNPLLFRTLCSLLQNTCFFCHKFRMKEQKVKIYAAQLDLIVKGDIAGARNLDSFSTGPSLFLDTDRGDYGISLSDESCLSSGNFKQQNWTSLQHREATSVLLKFMREKVKKCHNCGKKNPAISSPMFGWINMATPNSDVRANIIASSSIESSFSDGHKLNHLAMEEAPDNEDVLSGEESIIPSNEDTSGLTPDGMHRSASTGEKSKSLSDFTKQRKLLSGQLLPSEAKYHLEKLWKNEGEMCSRICNIQQECGCFSMEKNYTIFLMETLLVPPSKFRPPSRGSDHDRALVHPHNVLLKQVLESNNAIINTTNHSDRVRRWMDLQRSVTVLFDSSKGIGKDKETTGLRQLLEKKAGILRQKMMGKRVNFACRSVISPDPYLAVNEIGIPPHFALRLTYPERVTPWNCNKLRHCIINGMEFHPGATHYKDRERLYTLHVPRNARISISRKLPTSRGSHTQAGKGPVSEFEGKIVYRHLQDGDPVLLNRQPTLHKISIMAHKARILNGEKTLRMHYANCSTFNADFDGDEMNVHLPQDEVSRAEAINVVDANRQYVVPASGNPIRGLIQDHIVSAVLLSKKDTFLTRDEYHQLLYASAVPPVLSGSPFFNSAKKVCASCFDSETQQPLLPAILKPVLLWSGKQVITAILNHITRGRHPFTVKKNGKIKEEYLVKTSASKKVKESKEVMSEKNEEEAKEESKEGFKAEESIMIIDKNEFLVGMIDKEQFGMDGLVHTVHELYGPDTAGTLLSMFSRLFTVFLQLHGFTCGVDDLLIYPSSDFEREKILKGSESKSLETHLKFVGARDNTGPFRQNCPLELQMKIEEVLRSNGEIGTTRLDRNMSSALNRITSDITNLLIPGGLVKPFARNCVSLMTTSGAKGSLVNFNQISSLLGQQELEGKRVPRMVSGKTLPCFPPWDFSSRSGGFISDRFLTGLRPQEYYFHCMAGREGLVDTAIKTSRSGYLQRCLIKNLESLKVCYDHTVRDVDGSVMQFVYGNDGVDVHQTSFLTKFEALVDNFKVVLDRLSSQNQDVNLSECNDYLKELPEYIEIKAAEFISSLSKKEEGLEEEKKEKKEKKLLRWKEKEKKLLRLKKDKAMDVVKLKYLKSLAQAGEAVGVLASQSLGEQTTQMTLNTFHLAGRGDVNVTLGIPRLQEILMNARDKIQTPVMKCPFLEPVTQDDADVLAGKLRRITVADIIEGMEVCVVPFCVSNHQVSTTYKLMMKIYPPEHYPPWSDVTLEQCQETLEDDFITAMDVAIKKHLGMLAKISSIHVASSKEQNVFTEGSDEDETGNNTNRNKNRDADDSSGDEDETAEDQGSDAQKRKRQASDEVEYDDGMENESPGMVNDYSEGDEGHTLSGFESDIDQVEADEDYKMGEGNLCPATDDDGLESTSKCEGKHETGTSGKAQISGMQKNRTRSKRKKKSIERATFVETKGLEFQVHFTFRNEPHILLAEIAERTAKTVYVKQSANIEQCSAVKVGAEKDRKVKEVTPKQKHDYMLQTLGVNFPAFWDLEDHLDINKISSNDIHAVLRTYGVEAARKTIIEEVNGVFQAYGINVNIRHLTLIADFMTFNGDYRPLNRVGMMSYGTSPFGKITFETATKFIVEAAFHGEVDRLESPSSSICLGQPVKMGTGCFGLLQNLQL